MDYTYTELTDDELSKLKTGDVVDGVSPKGPYCVMKNIGGRPGFISLRDVDPKVNYQREPREDIPEEDNV